jgi:hypothetical protein
MPLSGALFSIHEVIKHSKKNWKNHRVQKGVTNKTCPVSVIKPRVKYLLARIQEFKIKKRDRLTFNKILKYGQYLVIDVF